MFTGNKIPAVIDGTGQLLNLPKEPRILLLRQDRLGDVIISVPTIRLLREHLPDARIDILLSKKNIGAKNILSGYIDNFFLFDKKTQIIFEVVHKLRITKYDLVIDMLENRSTTSALMINAIKPKYSLGINKEKNTVYDYVVPALNKLDYHIVRRTSQLLLPFGIIPDLINLELEYTINNEELAAAKAKLNVKPGLVKLGINIAGSDRARFWGVEKLTGLIKKINENYGNTAVIVFGTRNYEAELREITNTASALLVPFADSFHEYAAMLSTCDIILTPDTVAVHLASAWRKPCICLFSAVDDTHGQHWAPYNSPSKVFCAESGGLETIAVDDVFNAFCEFCSQNISEV